MTVDAEHGDLGGRLSLLGLLLEQDHQQLIQRRNARTAADQPHVLPTSFHHWRTMHLPWLLDNGHDGMSHLEVAQVVTHSASRTWRVRLDQQIEGVGLGRMRNGRIGLPQDPFVWFSWIVVFDTHAGG